MLRKIVGKLLKIGIAISIVLIHSHSSNNRNKHQLVDTAESIPTSNSAAYKLTATQFAESAALNYIGRIMYDQGNSNDHMCNGICTAKRCKYFEAIDKFMKKYITATIKQQTVTADNAMQILNDFRNILRHNKHANNAFNEIIQLTRDRRDEIQQNAKMLKPTQPRQKNYQQNMNSQINVYRYVHEDEDETSKKYELYLADDDINEFYKFIIQHDDDVKIRKATNQIFDASPLISLIKIVELMMNSFTSSSKNFDQYRDMSIYEKILCIDFVYPHIHKALSENPKYVQYQADATAIAEKFAENISDEIVEVFGSLYSETHPLDLGNPYNRKKAIEENKQFIDALVRKAIYRAKLIESVYISTIENNKITTNDDVLKTLQFFHFVQRANPTWTSEEVLKNIKEYGRDNRNIENIRQMILNYFYSFAINEQKAILNRAGVKIGSKLSDDVFESDNNIRFAVQASEVLMVAYANIISNKYPYIIDNDENLDMHQAIMFFLKQYNDSLIKTFTVYETNDGTLKKASDLSHIVFNRIQCLLCYIKPVVQIAISPVMIIFVCAHSCYESNCAGRC